MKHSLLVLICLLLLPASVTANDYRHTGIYPATPAPYPPAEHVSIHIEKDRYEQGYLLRVYTEGVKPEDIQIKTDRGRLRLSVQTGQQQPGLAFHGSVRRSVRLPRDAVPSQLTTTSQDGVLEIRIPRRQ